MNQKLSDWASIAEIVSGVAIVVTLIVLILQVQGNTDELRAASQTTISGRIQAVVLATIENPRFRLSPNVRFRPEADIQIAPNTHILNGRFRG